MYNRQSLCTSTPETLLHTVYISAQNNLHFQVLFVATGDDLNFVAILFSESLLSLKKSQLLNQLDTGREVTAGNQSDALDSHVNQKPQSSKIDDEYAAFQVFISEIY